MKKGFFFTLDAFLSVFVLIAFATSIFYFSSQGAGFSFAGVQEKRLAGDALKVMTLDGSLESFNETVWAEELAFFFAGSGLSYNLTVETFEDQSGSFVLVGALSAQNGNASSRDVASVKTHFVSFDNEAIANYSIARLRSWH